MPEPILSGRRQIQTGQALPNVEIIRDGVTIFSSVSAQRTVDEFRSETEADRASIEAEIERLDLQIDQLRQGIEDDPSLREFSQERINENRDQISVLRDQLGALPDALDQVVADNIQVLSLNWTEDSSRDVEHTCSVRLGNAGRLVPIGVLDTNSPLTNTFIRIFWDVEVAEAPPNRVVF